MLIIKSGITKAPKLNGVSFILMGIYIGLYMMVSRLYLLDESFKRILYFIGSIIFQGWLMLYKFYLN